LILHDDFIYVLTLWCIGLHHVFRTTVVAKIMYVVTSMVPSVFGCWSFQAQRVSLQVQGCEHDNYFLSVVQYYWLSRHRSGRDLFSAWRWWHTIWAIRRPCQCQQLLS